MFECHVRFERIFASKIVTWAVAVTTIETVRMINTEITTQGTRKLDEIKAELNSLLSAAINCAITEQVLSSLQNRLGREKEI